MESKINLNEIKELINFFQTTNLIELDVESNGLHIRAKKGDNCLENNQVEKQIDYTNEKGLIAKEIKSPIVGVFYPSASPNSRPFVNVGKKIKKGDTICIIEAMKVMNEITSDYSGEIIEVCAKEGALVEFGQILFRLK